MYRLILALCCVGLVVCENVIVYNHQKYNSKLEVPCTIKNLKSIGYTISSGSHSKIELYVNNTIVDVNNCGLNICSYKYNQSNIDNCNILITNREVESEIFYVLDQYPNELDPVDQYFQSLTLSQCVLVAFISLVLCRIVSIPIWKI